MSRPNFMSFVQVQNPVQNISQKQQSGIQDVPPFELNKEMAQLKNFSLEEGIVDLIVILQNSGMTRPSQFDDFNQNVNELYKANNVKEGQYAKLQEQAGQSISQQKPLNQQQQVYGQQPLPQQNPVYNQYQQPVAYGQPGYGGQWGQPMPQAYQPPSGWGQQAYRPPQGYHPPPRY
ncbi:UNKNOWN [Stylonychia lemnae]|uniref:Uncharacterized protein n=1 Tax=Stylonychia lemnae TaxID=5949 RepID=A0A078AI62_STYLE|nr:UNKNOWN [Stylonychia lemnae]|eukprot:CDW81202.1 UNKNOWN [Stylonychia lemnae]